MSTYPLTSSQTIGPFFHGGLLRLDARRNVLVTPGMPGIRIRLEGHVYDGDKGPVPDAMIELWQADHEGRYHHPSDNRGLPSHPAFTGFGRAGTDENGAFWFETIKPGRVPFDARLMAPHICLAIFARGLLNHLFTRLYFADEPANPDDPVFRCVPPERRATLLARPAKVDGGVVYRLDLVLQGADETAFFNL